MCQRGPRAEEVGEPPRSARSPSLGPAWAHPVIALPGLWVQKCSDKTLGAMVGPCYRDLLTPREGSAQWGALPSLSQSWGVLSGSWPGLVARANPQGPIHRELKRKTAPVPWAEVSGTQVGEVSSQG